MMVHGGMIRVDDVSLSFGGLRAVDHCSLEIAGGSITGLIGPNGAGKSTLFNIIAGIYRPDAGRILLDGQDVTGWRPHRLFTQGLARTFQIAHEFSRLSVIENLMVVPHAQRGESLLANWFRWGEVRREDTDIRGRAEEVLDFLKLDRLAAAPAGNLSGGQKKLLELGRIMMTDARVVLLDEIGAGVNRTLLGELAGHIEALHRDHGYTFCVIEHDMDLIARLCDPVIVMAEGKVLTQGTMADIKADAAVIEAYLGAGTVHVRERRRRREPAQ